LSDPENRARFDRYGSEGFAATGGPRVDPSVFTDFSDIFGGSMGDLFGELFGMGGGFGGGGRTRRQGRGERGSNLLYRLEISFPEAVHGTEKTVRIPRLETCSRCGGRGAESEKGVSTCRTCGGSGQVHYRQGFFSMSRTCGTCGGRGRVISDPCPACRGQGRVQTEKTLTIKIPAGVDSGTRLR